MPNDVVARMDEIIQERRLLKHPFYQAWSRGELPLESLKGYASQYYHFERAYPSFLSGVHHRCEDPETRQLLLENLWDEEHGEENHVELWMRFCDALGLSRQEVIDSAPSAATGALIAVYRNLTARAPLAAGAAALYAFESQVPEVAQAKIDGLRRFYGMDGGRDVSFFEVHRALDLEHSNAEREMVKRLADTEADEDAAVEAADTATRKLWAFLDGVYGSA